MVIYKRIIKVSLIYFLKLKYLKCCKNGWLDYELICFNFDCINYKITRSVIAESIFKKLRHVQENQIKL